MSKPEKIFMIGPCRASVFRNTLIIAGTAREMPKVKFEVRFKDRRTGKWKGTSAMTVPELPKAILALQKAFEYLVHNKGGDSI